MIAIFTIIFAGIFKARFGAGTSQWDYALYLFCGLLPWNAFQESVQLSSSTIIGHANLVKRVVFPLETLPVSLSLAAVANQMFGTVALILAVVLLRREMHATIVFLPLLVIPQLLATFGAAWLLASLGVFVRDIVQGITLFLLAWMYLIPLALFVIGKGRGYYLAAAYPMLMAVGAAMGERRLVTDRRCHGHHLIEHGASLRQFAVTHASEADNAHGIQPQLLAARACCRLERLFRPRGHLFQPVREKQRPAEAIQRA